MTFATTTRKLVPASKSSIGSTTLCRPSSSSPPSELNTFRFVTRAWASGRRWSTLNTLVDDSDPDTDLSQIEHLLQTAEAIRADGHPRWFILTGLIHDLGKILCLMGEPQWAVVGDTFPVGCAYSPKVVYHEFFELNPDCDDARYSTRLGIYEANVGMDRVNMSWGHDEYLYHVVKDYLADRSTLHDSLPLLLRSTSRARL